MTNAKTTTEAQKTDREIEQEERLSQVTEEVARDARENPEAYLKETVVPAGGE